MGCPLTYKTSTKFRKNGSRKQGTPIARSYFCCPVDGCGVDVRVHVNEAKENSDSYILIIETFGVKKDHSDTFYRRKTSGEDRAELKIILHENKDTPKILSEKLLNNLKPEDISVGDFTAAPSCETLRKIKSEARFDARGDGKTPFEDLINFSNMEEKYVKELSYKPFRVIASILAEFPTILKLPNFKQEKIHFDATGSIIKTNGTYKKRVYHYSATKMLKKGDTIPIVEFITDSHTASNIAYCLASGINDDEFLQSQIFVVDFSMAIIKALAKIFGFNSTIEYVNQAEMDTTRITICKAHMAKQLKNLAFRFFTEIPARQVSKFCRILLSVANMKEAENVARCILTLCGSSNFTNDSLSQISGLNAIASSVYCHEFGDEIEMKQGMVDTDGDAEYEKSRFYVHFKQLQPETGDEIISVNPYFSLEFCRELLKRLAYFPLWGGDKQSNAQVESHFRFLKHDLLAHERPYAYPADFFRALHQQWTMRVKKFSLPQVDGKKPRKKQKCEEEEVWAKNGRLPTKTQIPANLPHVSSWGIREGVPCTNTCTLDNIFTALGLFGLENPSFNHNPIVDEMLKSLQEPKPNFDIIRSRLVQQLIDRGTLKNDGKEAGSINLYGNTSDNWAQLISENSGFKTTMICRKCNKIDIRNGKTNEIWFLEHHHTSFQDAVNSKINPMCRKCDQLFEILTFEWIAQPSNILFVLMNPMHCFDPSLLTPILKINKKQYQLRCGIYWEKTFGGHFTSFTKYEGAFYFYDDMKAKLLPFSPDRAKQKNLQMVMAVYCSDRFEFW